MENIEKIRHSLAHLLAMAVKNKYSDAKLGIGPTIDNGFYYDFDFGTVTPDEASLLELEKDMKALVSQNITFSREEISAEQARELFASEPYKLELIEELAEKGEKISIYRSGDPSSNDSRVTFTDLCAGPHIENTKEIARDAFHITHIAGAYWKGSEKNKMLTRIYAVAFANKKDLDDYIEQQEEAKKRDHRKIGKELKLFTLSELVGAGLPLLQPNGMIIRKAIEDYLWELHKNKGYDRVWTPHITKKNLYETSGHAAKFGEELFRVKGGDEEFYMKPMNCPHHMQIFSDNQFSYRQMPVRYFEPATVYRYEKAGQLAGLTRVRAITQDDGHLFCRVSQINEEVSTIVEIIKKFYTTMNMMEDYWVRLSVRGEDKSLYLGGDEVWDKAEQALEQAAKENNLNYKRTEGEAAFYGPKLDFMFKDAIGRQWQLATIQCDFNLPERFDLSFTNEKGEQERPVVIHRAISGSLERFMGVVIEHYAGNFPVWMSPIQVKIIPVRKNHNDYAKKISDELKALDIRVEFDDSDEGMGKKIRDGKVNKVPYMIVIGDKEKEEQNITVEIRGAEKGAKFNLPDFITKISGEIKERK